MPRRSDGTLSNKKKDRVRREAYAAAKAVKLAAASAGVQDGQDESTVESRTVGVFDLVGAKNDVQDFHVESPGAAPSQDVQEYHCATCEAPLNFGVAECPVCEMELKWEGIQ